MEKSHPSIFKKEHDNNPPVVVLSDLTLKDKVYEDMSKLIEQKNLESIKKPKK